MATVNPTNHGLDCPQSLIDSLPVLCKSTSQCPPVRALPPQVLASLHLSHILSHPPDNVLFPFLHGIEGENEAQNTFFSGHNVRVPKYRGLVWVACEEDLEADERQYGRSLAVLRRRKETMVEDSESESDSSDFDDDEDDEVQDETYPLGPKVDVMPMDIDGEADSPQDGIRIMIEEDKEKEKHMHPVVQRPAPIQIQTTNLSSFSSSSADTDLSTSVTTDTSTNDEFPPTPSLGTITSASSNSNSQFPKVKRDKESSGLVLLTSSFRPSEIIRRTPATGCSVTGAHADNSSGWEFIPAQVPDGISLRNFGIQVPIYATLSDIVVYSPKGPSPNAIALAQRLQEAIGKKWEERLQSKSGFATSEEQEEHLFKYNVFVLDADEEVMKKEIPHLLMRVCKNGVPGGSGTSFEIGPGGGAHTDGPDGHVFDMSDMDVDVDSSKEEEPNTVDFAQREKEEMRDLTKASEIISLFPSGALPVADLSNTSAHWDPLIGQVFLGNADDVPLAPDLPSRFRHAGATARHQSGSDSESMTDEDPFNYLPTNSPSQGYGYDICVECHDLAPFPTAAHLRAAEEHLGMLDVMWVEKCLKQREEEGDQGSGDHIPPRPPPNANAVIHLPFPSSPANSHPTMSALLPVIKFLEKWLKPVVRPPPVPKAPTPVSVTSNTTPTPTPAGSSSARRWSSVSSLMPSFPTFPSISSSTPASTTIPPPAPALTTIPAVRTRSFTSPAPYLAPPPQQRITPTSSRTRPLKVLIYSSDGYTESSVPALCLLMAVRELALPEAYLELQVAKRRSFFVYQGDVAVLRRVEGRLREDRERERERQRHVSMMTSTSESSVGAAINGNGKRIAPKLEPGRQGNLPGPGSSTSASELASTSSITPGITSNGVEQGISTSQNPYASLPPPAYTQPKGRPSAKSVSFAHVPIIQQPTPKSPPIIVPAQASPTAQMESSSAPQVQSPPEPPLQVSQVKGRPRASTSPWLPSLFGGDHQSWFNDPRFDGSFPSRVLPFLYLGNLNHATNVFMLHALGITHVVSVGECALIPPPHHMHGHAQGYMASSPFHRPGHGAHYVPGKAHTGQGSLWFEEREGRIKVMDIKGVCDDGIDTLEPQLEPICDWIDQARAEGGQVLVHCRVGVSRSATVTIAYVMKHLGLSLVDAYLIVRSRRLSVLIQPNMRLLYNLCGWEIKLAKERAGENEAELRKELARTLSWPYLAKEVHALNLKYLH
ncbi:hypothetical protein BDZ94DRAFT_1297544 [Collybia nuda]|uniref:Protein-tyrosine-phosphatase n=1 Tax=Collybia nuda TaxID=64659 RepID=A0A9P6CFB1_9AGAR|nr:hypothetical protein BDZ94DRAFT_1297544 [Collybia nuda]